jgi:ubiquinone biosynthesis protein
MQLTAAIQLDESWLRALRVHELVPERFAAWRPLVLDGFAFFLARLAAARRARILAEQLALDREASPAQRLVAVMAHCPTLHKLGQVLARHRPLPAVLRRQLQSLESLPATRSSEDLHRRVRAELAGQAPLMLGRKTLAEGSVAAVLPFTYLEERELRHGVLKVLKPGVEENLSEELAILGELQAFLAERGRQLGLPAADYGDLVQSVQRLLTREVKLAVEQRNVADAAVFYAATSAVHIPRLLPWCTPRLTAMERVFGVKVTESELSPGRRRRLAETMVEALIGQPFWSRSQNAVFHADLHAGNILLTREGRLSILDWSLTACIGKAEREALLAVVVGGLGLDAPAMCAALARLTPSAPDDRRLVAAVERALDRALFQGQRPGFDWLLSLVDDLASHLGGGFSDDLILFRKTWLSLAGVIADMAPDATPDARLLGQALGHLLAELPDRRLASATNRHFATHLSNADLQHLVAVAWLLPARYWLRAARGPAGTS